MTTSFVIFAGFVVVVTVLIAFFMYPSLNSRSARCIVSFLSSAGVFVFIILRFLLLPFDSRWGLVDRLLGSL